MYKIKKGHNLKYKSKSYICIRIDPLNLDAYIFKKNFYNNNFIICEEIIHNPLVPPSKVSPITFS